MANLSNKPVRPIPKKDVRKANQSLVINPISELGHTYSRVIPTNTGQIKYSKSNDPEYIDARKDFVNWYSDPATLQKFAKNTGYDPARLKDLVSKATSTPSFQGTAQKQPPVGTKAVFTTPDTGQPEEILYHQGIGKGPIQHELTHAGAMANVIGPALLRTLGSPYNQKLPSDINDPNFKSTGNSIKSYMSIPEEAYGNFHEFRVNLGLKPGEKIDVNNLRQRVKDKNLQQENFYNTFEDEKIVDAINKIAYNDNTNTNNRFQAAMGGNISTNLNQFDEGGTHEQNPMGGIPMGQNASVEEGETMKGNFVYSDRVILTPDIIGNLGLPKALAGKTASEASKIINKKFEDRSDNISESTKTSLLDKIAQAQEAVKAQEQEQLQQAMDANSTMAPEDQMNGQIPQGMEEYVQPEQEQLPTEQLPVDPSQMAYGGRVKMFGGGDPDATYLQNLKGNVVSDPSSAIGALGSLVTTGQQIFGKSKIDTSGANDIADTAVSSGKQALNGALSGATQGAKVGGLPGAAVMGTIGLVGGLIGGNKDKRALAQAQSNRQQRQFNTANSDFAMGGEIDPPGAPKNYKSKSTQRYSDLDNNPNRLKGETTENYINRRKYNDFRIRQTEDQNYIKKAYNEMNDDQKNDPNFITKSARKIMTSPIHFASYLHDKIDTGNTSKYKSDTRKDEDNLKGVNSALDLLMLGKGVNLVRQGFYDKVNPNAQSVTNQVVDYLGSNIVSQGIQDSASDYTDAWIKNSDNKKVKAYGGNIRQPYVKGGVLPIENLLKPAGLVINKDNIQAPLPNPGQLYNGNPYLDKAKLMLRDAGKAIKNNAGEALTYAPVATNLLQLKNLKKPEVVNAIKNDRKFNYDPVDTRSQLNIAQSEMDNTVNALSNANMSQGALSNSILAAGLNKNKVLSDAYFSAANQNNAMKMQGQSFDNATDEANIARQINADEINMANRGAYESAKSKLIADLGTNVGKIGKGVTEDKMVREMFGYTKKGDYYVKPDGTTVTPDEMIKAVSAIKGVKQPAAKGGYINKYKTIF